MGGKLPSKPSAMSVREVVATATAVLAAVTVYVAVHDHRRKIKKQRKLAGEQPIAKDVLLKILNKSSELAKSIIDQIRLEVAKLKQTKNLSDEQAMQIFQQNFELQLDRVIGSIRKQYKVTEKAMDSSFKLHQNDPEVQAAIQNMRTLSTQQPALTSSTGAGSSSVGGPSTNSKGAITITREQLKEIMQFNATMLETELKPIKEEMARQRRNGKKPEVNPQRLIQLQARISEQVQKRFGCSDEQVMAAVEQHGARQDPAFNDVLQRIATTLQSTIA